MVELVYGYRNGQRSSELCAGHIADETQDSVDGIICVVT